MNGEEPIALESSPNNGFQLFSRRGFSQKFEEKKSLIEESENIENVLLMDQLRYDENF